MDDWHACELHVKNSARGAWLSLMIPALRIRGKINECPMDMEVV